MCFACMFLFGLLGSTTLFHLTNNISASASASAADAHKDCLVGWI